MGYAQATPPKASLLTPLSTRGTTPTPKTRGVIYRFYAVAMQRLTEDLSQGKGQASSPYDRARWKTFAGMLWGCYPTACFIIFRRKLLMASEINSK